MCYGLCQAEITIYIVAQTIPLLRVLYLGKGGSSSRAGGSNHSRIATSTAADVSPGVKESSKGTAHATATLLAGREPSDKIELVQLSTGKIVAADSEEGRRFKLQLLASGSQPRNKPEPSGFSRAGGAAVVSAGRGAALGQGQSHDDPVDDDEVHRLWADMGLSRRAWSMSPETSPLRETTHSPLAPGLDRH